MRLIVALFCHIFPFFCWAFCFAFSFSFLTFVFPFCVSDFGKQSHYQSWEWLNQSLCAGRLWPHDATSSRIWTRTVLGQIWKDISTNKLGLVQMKTMKSATLRYIIFFIEKLLCWIMLAIGQFIRCLVWSQSQGLNEEEAGLEQSLLKCSHGSSDGFTWQ